MTDLRTYLPVDAPEITGALVATPETLQNLMHGQVIRLSTAQTNVLIGGWFGVEYDEDGVAFEPALIVQVVRKQKNEEGAR